MRDQRLMLGRVGEEGVRGEVGALRVEEAFTVWDELVEVRLGCVWLRGGSMWSN